MAKAIHPAALKACRNTLRLTQQKLSDNTKGEGKVSVGTIKRIETLKDGLYLARDRIADGLAKALGIEVEKLADPNLKSARSTAPRTDMPGRELRVSIDADTALAFEMTQHIYGIPIGLQVRMAALFTALLAEGSLEWRREQLSALDATVDKLDEFTSGHLAFVGKTWAIRVGIDSEHNSIEQRDIFGQTASDEAFDCGYNQNKNNPFADYLRYFARNFNREIIDLPDNEDLGLEYLFPSYTVGSKTLSDFTADSAKAKFAISAGHARLKNMPKDLLTADMQAKRVEWLISQIPDGAYEAYCAAHPVFDELFGSIPPTDSDAPSVGTQP